jgi:hypothetical protein
MANAVKKVQVLQPIQRQENSENTINTAKRRVCAYCRVSTDSDEQMESYNAQVSEYKKKMLKIQSGNLLTYMPMLE